MCLNTVIGSEKVKNDGQTKAEHLQESNNINKSLLVLGKWDTLFALLANECDK